MLNALKWLMITLLFVVIAAIAALALAVALIDPDDYRDRIADALQSRLDRPISLDGPLTLSVWPAITVSAEQVRIANPDDFGPGDLAAAEQVGFELAIAPLLRRQLTVDAVRVDGLVIDLQRDSDGRGNWESPRPSTAQAAADRSTMDSGPSNDTTDATQTAPTDSNESATVAAPVGFVLERVAGVSVRNASIAYLDAADGRQHRFSGVSVDTGEIRIGQPIAFDANGRGQVDQGPGVDMVIELTGDIDPTAQRVALNHIRLVADGSTLTGTFSLTDFLNPEFTFDLTVDTVDLDRYLNATLDADTAAPVAPASNGLTRMSSPSAEQSAARVTATSTTTVLTTVSDRSPADDTAADTDDPPTADAILALLDALRGDGQLRIGQLRVREVDLLDTAATLRFSPGSLDVSSLRSRVADGVVEGAFQFASNADGVRTGLEGVATDVRLDGLAPLQEAIPFPLDGRGTLRLSLAAESHELRGLEQQLNGVVSVDLTDINLPEQQIGGDVQARLTLPGGLRHLQLEIDQAELLLRDARFGEPGLALTLGVDARIDRDGDLARLDAFTLNGAGLTVSATGDLRSLDADGVFTGSLRADHAQLRKLLAAFGQPLSDAAEATVLQAVTMESQVRASRSNVELESLDLTLDQSRVQGDLALVIDPDAPALRYDLQIDTLDLTPYLTVFGADAETASNTTNQAPEASTARNWSRLSPLASALATNADASRATEPPPALLQSASVEGALTIDQLDVQGLRLEQVQAPVSGAKGQFAARPLTARLYGGSYQGALTVDLAKDEPVWTFDERLTDIASGPLLTALTGRNFIEGAGDARLQGSARGSSADALLASLDGKADFTLRDGAILGLNIAQLIREAEARIRGERIDDAGVARQTDFASLVGAFTLENGLASIDTLRGESPLFDIDGTGRIDLVDARIDLLLQVLLLQRLERADGRRLPDLSGVPIPLRIDGALATPSVRLDLERLLRDQFEDQLREEARELERELRDRARDELQRLLRRR